jgi:hypothetical protein
MKKLLLLICAFCAFVGSSYAQNTYNVFNYKKPAGYKEEKKQGFISYTKTNNAKGTYCIIGLYEQTKASATLSESFDANWQELVVQPYNVTEAPIKEKETVQDGWKLLSGAASFEYSGSNAMAMLITLQQGTADANIILITNGQEYLTDYENFIGTIKMNKAKAEKITTNTNVTPSNNQNNNTNSTQPDLWFTYTLSGTKYMTMEPKFYLVYPNGDFKDEAPWQGLLSFNVNQNKKEFPLGWGKFVMNKNGNGTFSINNYTEKVVKLTADKMDRPDASWDYMKCKSVNGLRLQGSYSTQKDWSTNTYFNSKTCKELLTLNKDGSFTDHGFFAGTCEYTNPKDAPGSGTYSIQNFTLQLKYKDGRITERLLCGLASANPFVENASLFIGHNMVYNK